MNKKLFLGMFAAAGMLFATSCSNDELEAVQSGNEAQVTFSLGLEGGIATRAISDGTGADKLVYAVYKLNAQGEPELQKVVGSDEKGQFVKPDFKSGDNVSITLAKGQTYQVAFWAQDGDCTEAYNTDDLTAVSVDYNAAVNNDELRDAFFKTEEFTVSGNKTIDVVLKRPFAQINVGVYETDWEAAVASGIKIQNSSVVIKNAANEINLLTGAVQGEAEVTYTLNEIPAEELKVDADGDGTKEAYKWLSMSYILVNDTHDADEDQDGTLGDYRTTLNSLQYTFEPENGNNIAFAEGLNSVPVQRNWRTNILGKILTGDIQFNITIDPVYDGDIIYPEATGSAQELEMAATFGGTFTQTEDINFGEGGLDIQADFIYNIEDGKTLTSGSATNYGIRVLKGTTTINGGNGNIDSKGGGIGVVNGSNLIFNGGNLDINTTSTSGRYLFYLEGEGSTVTINGGNFDFNKTQNQKRAYICAMDGTTAYVKGGTFGKASTRSGYNEGIKTEGTGKVIITGGTFGFDPTKWVADGYCVAKVGDNWYVNDINITVKTAEELAAALTKDFKNIKVILNNDIDLPISTLGQITGGSGEYKLGGENTETIEIDLNGKKLNITTTYWSNLGAKNDDAIFTIKNGTMTSSQATGTWNSYDLCFSNCNYVIENVEFDKAISFGNANNSVSLKNITINETHDYYAMWIEAVGQTVTIDGLTINSDGRGIKIDEQYVGSPAKVTLNINNATFKTANKAAIVVKSVAGAEINASNLNISEVKADDIHAVWVDEDAAAYADKVVVNGAKKAVEGTVAFVSDTEGLKTAFVNGGNVVIKEDFTLTERLNVAEGANVNLDLNGKTITLEGTSADPAFYTYKGSTLTITGNGTVEINDPSVSLMFPGGDVVIENGTFVRNVPAGTPANQVGAFFVGAKVSPWGSQTVTIKGGYFDGGYYNADAADIDEILAGTKTLTETADDIAKRGNSKDANKVRVAIKQNVQLLLNLSYNLFKVYGGTFVGANPAWGDEGCMLPTTPNYLRPWSYYQGALLEGQTFNENKLELPAGYAITKDATADGRPTYTVTYNK